MHRFKIINLLLDIVALETNLQLIGYRNLFFMVVCLEHQKVFQVHSATKNVKYMYLKGVNNDIITGMVKLSGENLGTHYKHNKVVCIKT